MPPPSPTIVPTHDPSSEPAPERPFLPIFLMSIAILVFVVVVLRWWLDSPLPGFSPKTPTQCRHWIALRGTLELPQVVCWKSKFLETSSQRIKRWNKQIRAAKPRCRMHSQIPLPAHGQRLVLFSLPSPHKSCYFQIAWMSGNTRIALGIPLRLNHDTADDLTAIPGLSLKLAQRIVAYRSTHGPFTSLDTLTHIKGIGPKTLSQLRHHLSIP